MRAGVNRCINELMEKLDKQNPNTEFDILYLLKRTSMNVILSCAFGINSNTNENMSDSFFRRCFQVFEFNLLQTILSICSMLLPELDFIWVAYFKYINIIRLWIYDHVPFMNRFIDTDPNTWLLYHVEHVIKQRCLHGNDRADLLQCMIEATDVFQNMSPVSLLKI